MTRDHFNLCLDRILTDKVVRYLYDSGYSMTTIAEKAAYHCFMLSDVSSPDAMILRKHLYSLERTGSWGFE